jgi:hypothetical protein
MQIYRIILHRIVNLHIRNIFLLLFLPVLLQRDISSRHHNKRQDKNVNFQDYLIQSFSCFKATEMKSEFVAEQSECLSYRLK